MAEGKSRGSILLEILIVVLIIALFATLLYPKKIWEQESKNTELCRKHMDQIFKAELIFLEYRQNYTNSLDELSSLFKEDSLKKDVVREYFQADTALAENLTKFLTQTDPNADLVIRNLLADTLRFAILEAIDYDSNLARIMLDRLENLTLAENIKAKRATGNDDVAILKELYRELPGIKIYEPLKDDDSLSHIFNRIIPEMPASSLVDTLYSLKPVWAQKIDSAVFYTIENFRMCPTSNREYKITVIDTSVIKYVDIECPLDSVDIDKAKSNFIKYRLGHLRLKNHGKVETGERSWAQ